MAKDLNTLARVRYRYDKLLHPVEWQDFRMRDILLIPPARKPKKDEVKVVEVFHGKDTRGKAAYEEALRNQVRASQSSIVFETAQKELEIQRKLLELGPRVVAHIEEDNTVRAFDFSKDCLLALAHRNEYVSDTIILAVLCMFKSWLDRSVQNTVYVIDPAISARLRDAQETPASIARWFTFCNFEVVDVLLLPYHNRDHWSLVSIDLQQKQCFLLNSISNSHKELSLCIRRLMDALDHCPPNINLWDSIDPASLEAPQQDDAHSCGWRLLIHAKYILASYFELNQPEIMRKDSFGTDYMYSFRADTILKLLSHASSKPPVQETLKVAESSKVLDGVIHVDADDLEEKTQEHVEEKVVEQQKQVEEAAASQEQDEDSFRIPGLEDLEEAMETSGFPTPSGNIDHKQ